MRIKVTQEHIDEGLKNVCSHTECVLGLAFRDAGFKDINVGGYTIGFSGKSGNQVDIPLALQAKHMEIMEYGTGPKPKPFEFEIRAVR